MLKRWEIYRAVKKHRDAEEAVRDSEIGVIKQFIRLVILHKICKR